MKSRLDPEVEVLVVGAGPAGSTAARLLALKGVRVILIDQKAAIRGKVCGEFVGEAGTSVLRRFGLLGTVWRRGGIPIQQSRLWTAGGLARKSAAGRTSSIRGFALSRDRLDEVLILAARQAGASVNMGTRLVRVGKWQTQYREVQIEHQGRMESLHPALIIGADGRRSMTAQQAGLTGRFESLGVGFQTHLRRSLPPPASVDFLMANGFYSGLVPVERDRWCLGVLAQAPAGHLTRSKTSLLTECIGKWQEAGVLPATDSVLEQLATYPVLAGLRHATAPGLLLAGDAAGSVDPLTGQGISLALESGVAAADAAERLLKGTEDTSRVNHGYQSYLNQQIGSRLLTSIPFRALLRWPSVAEEFMDGLSYIPGATRAIVWWARKAQIPPLFLRSWPLLPHHQPVDKPVSKA